MEAANRHVQAFLWIAGFIGAISTVAGVFKGHALFILTAAGYIGVAWLPAMAVSFWFERDKTPSNQMATMVGGLCGGVLFFLIGGLGVSPSRASEWRPLSYVGVVTIGVLFIYGVHVFNAAAQAKKETVKTCPDCANVVLAAARVCQHCGYRFAPALQGE